MAKKKSKLKSALKKIGKAAAVAGAGYLAMKGLKGRKETAADANDGFRTRSKFKKPSIGMVTDGSNQRMPDNISKSAGPYQSDKYAGTPLRRIQNSPLRTDGLGDMDMKDGGRAKHKSGGSVKKSMGKALRGGGKVMR